MSEKQSLYLMSGVNHQLKQKHQHNLMQYQKHRTMKKIFNIAVALLFTSAALILMSMDTKKPKLKGTVWKSIEKEFVADAGNMTITQTLEFTSGKEVTVTTNRVMPPHHAMRKNPDGTVSTIPGWESSDSKKGTYKFKSNMLTITFEDGYHLIFLYRDEKFVAPSARSPQKTQEFTLQSGI